MRQPLSDLGLRGVEIGKDRPVCRAHQTEAGLQEPHPGQILVNLREPHQHCGEKIVSEDQLAVDVETAGPDLHGL